MRTRCSRPTSTPVLQGINNDLSNTNANDRFGRDVGFGKTILFEFGARHAFNPDLVIDISAYNKSKVSDLSYRIFNFDDPTNHGRQLTINVLTNGDFGYDRGVDMKLDRRIGNWLVGVGGVHLRSRQRDGLEPLFLPEHQRPLHFGRDRDGAAAGRAGPGGG